MITDKLQPSEEDWPERELTERILGAVFKVQNSLGVGFLEKVYENAMVVELSRMGIPVEQQKSLQVCYDGAIVGDYFGGTSEALGQQIRSSVGIGDFEYSWAAIMVASILGIAFYAAVALAERLALSWHPSTRGVLE